MAHDHLCIVNKGILESLILVAAVGVSDFGLVRGFCEIAAEELERSIEMKKGDLWSHSLLKNEVDHIIVVVNSLLVHRRTRQRKRQDSCPSNTKREVLGAHSSNALNILLVVVIVLIRNVVFGTIIPNQDIHERRRLALLSSSTLDLTGRARNAKAKVLWEIVAV